jgi:hypothetical protein
MERKGWVRSGDKKREGERDRERKIDRYRMRGENKPFTGFIDTEQKQRCSLTRMQ